MENREETGRPSADFPGRLKSERETAYRDFQTEAFRAWTPGSGLKLCRAMSAWTDAMVARILDSIGGCPSGIAVLAVGGYGRGELSPHSDIDLLILHDEKADISSFARQFLNPLWDSGWSVGYSTRTIANVLEHADSDEYFFTSLLEYRVLAGDAGLVQNLEKAWSRYRTARRLAYSRQKIFDLYSLVNRSDDMLLLKEPDLKNGPGGLRSVHHILWLNALLSDKTGLESTLAGLPGILSRRLRHAYDLILSIRNVLHFIDRRKQDRLYMDAHLRVAEALGMPGDANRKMTALMRHYYSRAQDILNILLYSLEKWETLTDRTAARKIEKLSQGRPEFLVMNNRIYVSPNLKPDRLSSLRILKILAEGRYGFTHSLVTHLKKCLSRSTGSGFGSHEGFRRFQDILQSDHSAEALQVLRISGFLYRLVPGFNRIRHRILYNPYHRYTVDQHSIAAVSELEKLFASPRTAGEYTPAGIFRDVAVRYRPRIWVLKLALLLHDTGKGYPGDHSRNGVELVFRALKDTGLYHSYADAVLFLVRNHLLLSNMIRRSDVSRGEVLQNLAGEFERTAFPEEYLDFLFLMTYADTVATHPSNLTGYLADLLVRTRDKVLAILNRYSERGYHRHFASRVAELTGTGKLPGDIEAVLKELGDGYLSGRDEKEAADDLKTLWSLPRSGHRIDVRYFSDYLSVKFFVPDRTGLFAFLTGILFLNGSDIVRAWIGTVGGMVLDEFVVTRIHGLEVSVQSRREELEIWRENLERDFERYQNDPDGLENAVREKRKTMGRVSDIFQIPASVHLSPVPGGEYRLEISGTDRPALLYGISSRLSALRVDIRHAVIDTTGWYVRDTFVLKASDSIPADSLTAGLKLVLDEK